VLISAQIGFSLLLLVAGGGNLALAIECTPLALQTTGCVTAGLGGGEVTLETGGGSGGGASGGDSGGGSGDDGWASIKPIDRCRVVEVGGEVDCKASALPAGAPDPVAGLPPISLADIARFRPDPGVDSMQPNGWMIVGLDTNFFSTGGAQIRDGELLGRPASVRFTPVQWNWTYGDGASASRPTAGARWESQGIAEFDPTPTSHRYGAPGTYYIDLDIDYRAEYRYSGTNWIAIPGILNLPANQLVATAGGAKTVLVERDCTLNPTGPGC